MIDIKYILSTVLYHQASFPCCYAAFPPLSPNLQGSCGLHDGTAFCLRSGAISSPAEHCWVVSCFPLRGWILPPNKNNSLYNVIWHLWWIWDLDFWDMPGPNTCLLSTMYNLWIGTHKKKLSSLTVFFLWCVFPCFFFCFGFHMIPVCSEIRGLIAPFLKGGIH